MVKLIAQRDQTQDYLNRAHILEVFIFRVPSSRNYHVCLVYAKEKCSLCNWWLFNIRLPTVNCQYPKSVGLMGRSSSQWKTIDLLFVKDKLLNKDQVSLTGDLDVWTACVNDVKRPIYHNVDCWEYVYYELGIRDVHIWWKWNIGGFSWDLNF